jgi:hypothetical protein
MGRFALAIEIFESHSFRKEREMDGAPSMVLREEIQTFLLIDMGELR